MKLSLCGLRRAVAVLLTLVVLCACPLSALAADASATDSPVVEYSIYDVASLGFIAADAGSVSVTITGIRLSNGFAAVLLYADGEVSRSVTTGSSTEQTAVLPVPTNIAHSSEVYSIRVDDPNGVDIGETRPLIVSPVKDTIYADSTLQKLESVGGAVVIDVNSNFSWNVADISCSWLSASSGGTQGTTALELDVTENTGDSRAASVRLCTEGEDSASVTIQIEQSGTRDPYSAGQLSSEELGFSVSGVMHSGATLSVKALSAEDEVHQFFAQKDDAMTIIAAYDAQLRITEDTLPNRSALQVSVSVDAAYNGKPCTIVGMDPWGEEEILTAIVSGGKVIFVMNALITIALMLPTESVGGGEKTPDSSAGLGNIGRIVLYSLGGLLAICLLLVAFALIVPRRTLKTADGGAVYYVGKGRLPEPIGRFVGWIWRTAARLTLSVKGWFKSGK